MSEIESYRGRDAKQSLAKKLTVAVWIISAAVLFLVGLMRQVKFDLPEGMSLDFLPPLHALIEFGGGFCFVDGGFFHQRWESAESSEMDLYGDVLLPPLSPLLRGVSLHYAAETIYGDLDGDGALNDTEREEAGGMRLLYLCILLSHIALAAISLPFILLTFVYGFTNQFEKHRTMAKKVFPVWLYVAITGPIVYLLLKPYY